MTTASTASVGVPNVPYSMPDEKAHRKKLAEGVNSVLGGKMNCTLDATLASSASSTTITDSRISYYSAIVPGMALTAHAAAELASGNLYIPQSTIIKGQAVIQHTNNTQTDRTLRFVILG
jgi:hypothetical protein